MPTKILIYFLLIIFFFAGLHSTHAQKDTSTDKKNPVLADLPDSIKKLPARITLLEKKAGINNTIAKDTTSTTCDTCAVKCNISSDKLGIRWWLIFLPLILFLTVGGFFMYLILRGKFELAEALSIGQPQPEARVTDADGKVTEIPKPVSSTSRLIAFLTGLTAILIAVCIITYHAYFTLAECEGDPGLESLWTILAGLGIGIIPYGVNVWRGNKKETNINAQDNNT